MYTCPTCHSEYTPKARNQSYCSKACRPTYDRRTNREKNENRAYKRQAFKDELQPTQFIAIDGESVWNGDSFDYCLLSCGANSIHRNGDPLSLHEIFDFLYGQFLELRHNNPREKLAFVGFFLSFDFTMWLRQLPEERARMLFTAEGIAKRQRKVKPELGPFPVQWRDWEFDLLGDKRFKLRPKPDKHEKCPKWMYICDTGPFFQTSLLNAANPKKWPAGLIDKADYDLCVEGKSHRGDAGFDQKLIDYNLAENRILSAMLSEYERGLHQIGIKLNSNQWFGPGQCSSKWLSTTPSPPSKEVKELPEALLQAARASYYGGRFEVFQHGHIPGETHEYDINSAYPAAMVTLPNILRGEWRNTGPRKSLPKCLSLVRGHFSGSSTIGALPYRTTKGRILYPKATSGWYWSHEIAATQRAGLIDSIEIEEVWQFYPTDDHAPLAGIGGLYDLRQKVGKESSEGKALKLVYNSAYGKMAQSVGAPKFANPFYASLITSGCRTKILQAIASHPNPVDDLVMIATDGIYFRSPHDGLPQSENLGEWGHNIKRNLTTFLPGIYWDDSTRERLASGQGIALKSRGISGGDLANRLTELDELFRQLPKTGIFPELDIPIRFTYLSLKQALIGRNPLDRSESRWPDAGKPLSGKIKHIKSCPSDKRDTHCPIASDTIRFNAHDYPGQDSTPYKKGFGMFDETASEILRDLASIDGSSIHSDLANMLYEK